MVNEFLQKAKDFLVGLGDKRDEEVIHPATEDSFGEAGNQGNFGNVRPASEDPYGDPADEEN
ncbi:hypothetical protein MEO40_06805 [Dolichospermum sp. ST_sed1]|nr:hypothetical protein [Dolichospermum sp. ST_sed1]MDD1424782.1 hypothetical protein [Dolichospermum sp. ST_sed9]MDD1431261.1 hypothetical protein [Dolichospermum sp. ST_sed6]MDD1440706.1 hypothetical protein [Dolichospermum sp. ST_sed3]MDD1446497.1 hypothetical protein [Dolichospermum sp. ST_sed8]MDD1454947.1 hypothetical protein [Dolichospermum sp. ST_sed7]MDD1460652.1 hypothetical protein [Dolichospermum sp. ST_sed2]MDD1464556.1 hypothetical protein [Dolichospermum sp. ST_sed5]MDD147046